jgi:hypothetical protein
MPLVGEQRQSLLFADSSVPDSSADDPFADISSFRLCSTSSRRLCFSAFLIFRGIEIVSLEVLSAGTSEVSFRAGRDVSILLDAFFAFPSISLLSGVEVVGSSCTGVDAVVNS